MRTFESASFFQRVQREYSTSSYQIDPMEHTANTHMFFLSSNVKFYTNIPQSSMTQNSIDLQNTYLDTVGRTVLTLRTRNLVDEFSRNRELTVTYDYPFLASLRKPFVVFTTMLGIFIVMYIIGGLEVKIGSSKK